MNLPHGLRVLAVCIALAATQQAAAFDSSSLELGTGAHTRLARFGLQWKWEQSWWKSGGTHLTGYWDATLAYWRGNRYQNVPGARQSITAIGITPVFRFEKVSGKGTYVEAGVGAHLLSHLYDNGGRRLSTRFQFGDHIAVGYVFDNGLDLKLKLQHFSNGSIKKPNDGVNFAAISASYPF